MKDEQLELELEDQPEVKEPKSEDKKDDGIEELKKQLAAERESRIAAEQKVREVSAEAVKAKSEVEDNNILLVKNAIDSVNSANEKLKQDYAAALQSGDYAAAADLQLEMTKNATKLTQLEVGLDSMKNKPKKEIEFADPVEHFAGQLSPRSADWIRKHPEYVKDARLNSKMLLAHAVAVDDGFPVDSDGYFEAIEKRLGIIKDTEENDDDVMSSASRETSKRESAPASAPVSRSKENNNRSNVVRLTAEEKEIAEMNGMTLEQYAKAKADLKKEGKIH